MVAVGRDASSPAPPSPCIIIELCAATVQRGAEAIVSQIQRQSKRTRLPEGVEKELSAAVKRSISEAESKMKGGGGVIRSIPIVGSWFSYFAGKGGNKGHSYDIGSSYQAEAKAKAKSSAKAATPVTSPPPQTGGSGVRPPYPRRGSRPCHRLAPCG